MDLSHDAQNIPGRGIDLPRSKRNNTGHEFCIDGTDFVIRVKIANICE